MLFGGGGAAACRPVEQLRPAKSTKSKQDAEAARKLAELNRLRDKLQAQVHEQLLLKKRELEAQIKALGGAVDNARGAP